MAKMGRPTVWNQTIEDHIIDEMSERGRSLRSICRDDLGMPAMMTVLRELDRNPTFVARYARARETMADHAADDAMEIARASTAESAPADRVKLMAMQWYASKLRPRVYGVDSKTTITGPGDGPIQIAAVTLDASELDDDQRAAMRAALLAAAAPK
jgi:hypothetical protein